MQPNGLITLLTDFGWQDGYVAAMKGVILSAAPAARLVDAAHDVQPQDIVGAGWALAQYWACYPAGTIHLAVVDPGVGTDRAALLAEADGQWFLAPDNGLLDFVAAAAAQYAVRRLRPGWHRPAGCAATFHGRDIFAYAAGRLVAGDDPAAFTDSLAAASPAALPAPRPSGHGLAGRIIHCDRFGNLITNIAAATAAEAVPRPWHVLVAGYVFEQVRRTYADVAPGEKLALFGSSGLLELAINQGSARERLRLDRGAPVQLRTKSGGSGHETDPD
ncbi:MAG: SAM-dependent chlorinase/fluorinase [Candidatus Marinimicrobia bacterium]|nr:SAM-dependent chlorinase/fluorinase [Candidatus Neomarinimicrobiota bacterium]